MDYRNPDKQRYLNALNRVPKQDVPFLEIDTDFTVVEQILGRKVGGVRTSYQLPGADYIEFIRRMGMDMAYVAVTWRLGRKERLDPAGRRLYEDGTVKTRADLRRITDPGDDEVKRRLDEMCAAVDGTGIGLLYNHWNTPVTVTTAVGYEDYYLALREDPDFVRECFKVVDPIVVRRLELILTYPVDAFLLVAILAMSSGPIMSEDLLEEFEFPYLQRNMEMVGAKGVPMSFHCDGDNRRFYPRLIDMGIRGLQAIDPCGGRQDPFELKAQYGGRVAIHGDIDSHLLMTLTPEKVAEYVASHIERMTVGGGYVCGSSHDLHQLMPIANIRAMVDTVHRAKAPVPETNHQSHARTYPDHDAIAGDDGKREEGGQT